jgi:hypothetical protein
MASPAGKTEKLELNRPVRSGVAILAGDRAACGDTRTCGDTKSKVPYPSPSIDEGWTGSWANRSLSPHAEPRVRIQSPPADSPCLAGFPPPPLEKPGFSAVLAAIRGGSVGRDAQSPATSRRGGVMSLSVDIPVPQCCRTQFARLAAPAANEVGLAISVRLGVRIGSSKAEQGPLILPGQWQT